ncbi:DUF1173 family protein (plasmid) [Cupriavidus basilensis]
MSQLIYILGKAHTLSELMESEPGYNAILEQAKRTVGYAECGCVADAPYPKLQIRRHGTTYLLARWPEQAQMHARDCPFGRAWASKNTDASATAPILLKDGALDIKLDLALSVVHHAPSATAAKGESSSRERSARRSVGLLAFLEYAWETAGLNTWPGDGHRSWATCWARLTAELGNCQINRQPAADVLHVIRRYEPDKSREINQAYESFLGGLTHDAAAQRRGLIIGEAQSLHPNQYGGVLVLRQSSRRYFLPADLHTRIRQSHATALSGIGSKAARCVIIIAVAQSRKGYLMVKEFAAMLTNAMFLPADSSHEVAMANRLIREGRVFEKPLRYLGEAPVHPDFVLRDTSTETVIEVYGMVGNPEYDAMVSEQRRHYARAGTRVVEWIPQVQAVESVLLPPIAPRGRT